MPIKYRITKAEHGALDDATKKLYVAKGDGFTLDADVDADELETKLGEFRTNNIGLKRQLEAFGDLKPEDAKALRAKLAEYEKGGAPTDVEAALARRMKPLEDKLAELERQRDEANLRLVRSSLETKLWELGATLGVREKARADFLSRALEVFDIDDDGELVALNAAGEPIMSQRAGKRHEPMTAQEWIGEVLVKDADHLFKTSEGSGKPRRDAIAGGNVAVVANDPVSLGQNIEGIAKGTVAILDR